MAHKAPSLPPALKRLIDLNRWVVWRWEVTKKGKPTKVPYQAHHPERKASTKDPQTWAPYAVAAKVRDVDGIGFVLTDTEFAAFDIDDCRNAATGEIHPWAQKLVERANSYTEITTSGTGLRIIGLAKNAVHHRKQPAIDGVTCEAYSHATRYIAMTGDQLNGAGLVNLDTVMDEVVAELDQLNACSTYWENIAKTLENSLMPQIVRSWPRTKKLDPINAPHINVLTCAT